MSQPAVNRISLSDTKLITPHLLPWTEALGGVPPDAVLTKADLDKLLAGDYFGTYRDLLLGALIRYSLARGELAKMGSRHYVRVGRSRESAVELAQIMSLAGWLAEEISPGTVLGYEDLSFEDGRKERHYNVFARRIGETFQWIIASKPIICRLKDDGKPDIGDRESSLIARRLESVLLL